MSTLSQVATAIAGAAIGPAVAGMTLGIVRQAGFPRQNGRNQAFNHAGNMIGAGLSGYLGWRFGYSAIFWLAVVFAVLNYQQRSNFVLPDDGVTWMDSPQGIVAWHIVADSPGAKAGIRPGDMVVTKGPPDLRDGESIQLKK